MCISGGRARSRRRRRSTRRGRRARTIIRAIWAAAEPYRRRAVVRPCPRPRGVRRRGLHLAATEPDPHGRTQHAHDELAERPVDARSIDIEGGTERPSRRPPIGSIDSPGWPAARSTAQPPQHRSGRSPSARGCSSRTCASPGTAPTTRRPAGGPYRATAAASWTSRRGIGDPRAAGTRTHVPLSWLKWIARPRYSVVLLVKQGERRPRFAAVVRQAPVADARPSTVDFHSASTYLAR